MLKHTRRTPYDEEFHSSCEIALHRAACLEDPVQVEKVKAAIRRAHTLIQATPQRVEQLFHKRLEELVQA